MPKFNCLVHNKINGIDIFLYEMNLNQPTEREKLVNYIKLKIKKMQMHNNYLENAKYFSPNMNPNLIRKFKTRMNEITTPSYNSKKWFDVRRSRVTEFMAELLLEKKQNCVFYDEADKRINLSILDLDKHASGIDVTGVYKENKEFKFVICEVKASKEANIPCSSSDLLLEDIKKAYVNVERINKDIAQYIKWLDKGANPNDEVLKNIIRFLTLMICESSSKDVVLKNVIFFPFLIRNNPKISRDMTLDDFINFNSKDFIGTNMKGIIWSFNEDIDSFCINIYDEVLKDAECS